MNREFNLEDDEVDPELGSMVHLKRSDDESLTKRKREEVSKRGKSDKVDRARPSGANESARSVPLGDLLLKEGVINEDQLELALKEQKQTKERLGQVLKDLGFINDMDISRMIALQAGVEHTNLSKRYIDSKALHILPEAFARHNRVIPLSVEKNVLYLGMVNPFDTETIDEIERRTGMVTDVSSISEPDFVETIGKAYGLGGSFERIIDECIKESNIIEKTKAADLKLKSSKLKIGEESSPTIKLVDQIINYGISKDATDIHIEPEEKVLRIRYRIDGKLIQGPSLPRNIQSAIIARVKILSQMNISESRIPQDGKIKVTYGEKKIDLRVSTMPTVDGETVVLRILDKSKMAFGLNQLGFSDSNLKIFKETIKNPNGIILVTGPTGSGKTTTLYTALNFVSSIEKKLITMEDPVEYELPIIRQSQINERAGYTFSAGLRAILRQDPDIILIGEMRDQETAEMAIRAALTGHLVFSTLHTNNAAGAIPRLTDMGIDPFLPASSIIAVLAQRLVRTICSDCKEEVDPSPTLLRRAGLEHVEGKKFYKGTGCVNCNNTGLKGRKAIHEILQVTPRIGDLVMGRADGNQINAVAIEEGMETMFQDGLKKVHSGVTTLEELLSVVISK